MQVCTKKETVGDFTGFVCDEAAPSSENLIYHIYQIIRCHIPEHNVICDSSDSATYPPTWSFNRGN